MKILLLLATAVLCRAADVDAIDDKAMSKYLFDMTKQQLAPLLGVGSDDWKHIELVTTDQAFDWNDVELRGVPAGAKGSHDISEDFSKEGTVPVPQCDDGSNSGSLVGDEIDNSRASGGVEVSGDCCRLCFEVDNCVKWAYRQKDASAEDGLGRCVLFTSADTFDADPSDFWANIEESNWMHGILERPNSGSIVTVAPTVPATEPSTEAPDDSTTPPTSDMTCQDLRVREYLDTTGGEGSTTNFHEQYMLVIKDMLYVEDVDVNETLAESAELDRQFFEVFNNKFDFQREFEAVYQKNRDLTTMTLEEYKQRTGFYGRMQKFDDQMTAIGQQQEAICGAYCRVLKKLDKFTSAEPPAGYATCYANQGGDKIAFSKQPTWLTDITPEYAKEVLSNPEDNEPLTFSVHLEGSSITESIVNQRITEDNGLTPPFLASWKDGTYRTHTFTQNDFSFTLNITVKAWTKVKVTPGPWYDSTWLQTAEITNKLDNIDNLEATVCKEDDDGDLFYLVGDGGLLPTITKEFIVATDLDLFMELNSEQASEMEEFFDEDACHKVGNFCEGPICDNVGNVIIGGDDLWYHGSHSNGVNNDGWKYIEVAVREIYYNSWGENDGSIAVLGSAARSYSTAMSGDCGKAIMGVTRALGISESKVSFYKGRSRLEDFFDHLEKGTVIPRMIWIPGTSPGSGDSTWNSVTDDEGDTIETYSSVLMNFLKNGGGMVAHYGWGSDAGVRWVKKEIPDLQINVGCQYVGATVTDEGRSYFPFLSDHAVQNICHAVFSGDLDPWQILVLDGNKQPLVIGGHIGNPDVGPRDCSDTASTTSTPTVGKSVFHLPIKSETPLIFSIFRQPFEPQKCTPPESAGDDGDDVTETSLRSPSLRSTAGTIVVLAGGLFIIIFALRRKNKKQDKYETV